MPDEPSLHDILRGSLAHHAEHLGDPSADIATVWSRVDRRRARRRGIAVVGSVVAVAAGAAGIMLVANPSGSTVPLDGSDGSAALSWACTGPLGSDGTYDYFEACDRRPRPVAPSTTPASIVGSTIAGSVIVSTTVPSAPPIGTAPPTTAFSPFVRQYEQQYVVVEGDSYFSITDRFGLEPDALHNYNGWPDGVEHILWIGDTVLIPPTDIATVSTLVYAEQQHEVAPGDSLTAIAERYGVDLNTLVNYNAWPEGHDHPIFPGDVVRIPPGAAAPLAPQCVTPTAPPTVPDGGAAPPDTTAPGTVTCVTYPPPTAPPTLAPVGSVTEWTGPTCAPTTTAPADVSDVSVPCGSVPDGFATGPYRCTGLLGADELYRYYTSCEQTAPAGAPVSTITFPGTVAAAATTTTTTTTTSPPPASESGDAATASTVPGEVQYTIGLGDNPSKVADMFGITVDELVDLNPEVSRTFLVGQVLRLPPGTTVVDPQEQLHVVVEGDSIASIADPYDITVEALVSYNAWPEGVDHALSVGDEVKIPPGARILGLG